MQSRAHTRMFQLFNMTLLSTLIIYHLHLSQIHRSTLGILTKQRQKTLLLLKTILLLLNCLPIIFNEELTCVTDA